LVLVDKNLSSSLQKKKENGKKGYNFRRNAWKVLSLASARKLNNEVINHNEADAINIGKFASSEENGGC